MQYTKISDEFKEIYNQKFLNADKSKIEELAREDPVIFSYSFLGKKIRLHQAYLIQRILEAWKSGKKRVAMCLARQLGKSIGGGCFVIWADWYNKFPTSILKITSCYLISRDDSASVELLDKIRGLLYDGDRNMKQYTGLDNFFTGSLKEPNNSHQITFLNGCFIKSLPPTGQIFGKSASIVWIDEAHRLKSEDPDKFYNQFVVPTTAETGGIIILSSSPEGICYDKETEVLTENGFKLFKDVADTELVYSRNPETGIAELVSIEKRTVEWYQDDMIKIKSRNLDLCVTKGHDLVGYRDKSPKRIKIKAGNLIKMKTSFWIDRKLDMGPKQIPLGVRIPPITYRHGQGFHTTKEWYVQPDKFYRWLGFFLAEGGIAINQIHLTQKNRATIDEFYLLTTQLFTGLAESIIRKHGEDAWRIVVYSKQLCDFVRNFKFNGMPKPLLEVPNRFIQELWDGFYVGDGDHTKGHIRIFVDSRHKGLIEDMYMIALRLFGGAHKNYQNQWKSVCVVSASKSLTGRCKVKTYESEKQISYEPYSDFVYCFTVRHGELYVRRNGRTAWCGNTGFFYEAIDPDHMDVENGYERIWFSHTIWDDDSEECIRYQEFVAQEKERLGKEGRLREWQQEYEASFTVTQASFFLNEDIDAQTKNSVQYYEWQETPCSLGIDYGLSSSRTVLTIRTLHQGKIRQLFQYECPAGFDNNLLTDPTWEHSIQSLKRRYNLFVIVPDDSAPGDQTNRWLEQYSGIPVKKYNFRSDQMSKTDGVNRNCAAYSYRAKLKDGTLEIPAWNKTQIFQMKTIQETVQKILISIKSPEGHLCDCFDSDMMACIPFLDMTMVSDFEVDSLQPEITAESKSTGRTDETGFKKLTDAECLQMIKDREEGIYD